MLFVKKKDKLMDEMLFAYIPFLLAAVTGVDAPPIIDSLSNGYSYNI